MKKILVLLLSVILSVLLVATAGCGAKNEFVEDSLDYDIARRLAWDDISGSFKIKVRSGTVTDVKFTVKGYNNNGKEIWSKNFHQPCEDFDVQDDPYDIVFDYTHFYNNTNVAPANRTDSITVTEVKIIKENSNSNEWMGWTFGAISAAATLAVIALFVLSKLKSKSEASSENSETEKAAADEISVTEQGGETK